MNLKKVLYVVIVDDYFIVLGVFWGELVCLLEICIDLEVENGEVLISVFKCLLCEIVIIDFVMLVDDSDELDGFVLVKCLKIEYLLIKVIVYIVMNNGVVICCLYCMGVFVVINKCEKIDELINVCLVM